MTTTEHGVAPYTSDIGDGPETFPTLSDVQRAVYTRISGIRSSREWYGRLRSKHGAKVRDTQGRLVAKVSYNARLWEPCGKREEIVL